MGTCYSSIRTSVTRYWSKNVAQMFPKVAQIDTTVHKVILFEMTPKVTNLFGATLVSKFDVKNFIKSLNLVTLVPKSRWVQRRRLSSSQDLKLIDKNFRQKIDYFYLSLSYDIDKKKTI